MTKTIRGVLDALYFACGILAALCLVAILVLIVLQMVARWTGEVFSGAPDYAGYAMAAASFLAFAHALNRGAHIRVAILLVNVPPKARRWVEVWCFAIGTALAWYFVYYGVRFVYWSWKFNDVSQGTDATPLWIPQSAMLFGAFVFALALTDHLLALFTDGHHRIVDNVVEQSHGE
ncbi:TRAP transporter small permease [Acuticoccus mangrovi]|uniref:TRAP transporter small permease protein n=1 Tax=Acuticoccus mangrovi TaxID=2796142 RepID=A0A934IKG6_9HYPH|nr:TRAP transporter small permease [Acuticoccus mangrovi]MBJ3778309.1 TRAP transporter small permease [Acuticoccus mangrovi]